MIEFKLILEAQQGAFSWQRRLGISPKQTWRYEKMIPFFPEWEWTFSCESERQIDVLRPSKLKHYPALSRSIKVGRNKSLFLRKNKRRGPVNTKSLFTLLDQPPAPAPDQGQFCSNSQGKEGVVNWYPRGSMGHSILVTLGGVNYL